MGLIFSKMKTPVKKYKQQDLRRFSFDMERASSQIRLLRFVEEEKIETSKIATRSFAKKYSFKD